MSLSRANLRSLKTVYALGIWVPATVSVRRLAWSARDVWQRSVLRGALPHCGFHRPA